MDGFLAKRFNWETELGAYLDPLADKLLIVCIFVALGVTGKLPSWLVIAVVSRDMLIVIAVVLSWLLGHPTPMRPIVISKANTVAQIVLAAVVLADEAFGLRLKGPVFVLIWVTGALTVASLIAYLRVWLRHMTLFETTGPKIVSGIGAVQSGLARDEFEGRLSMQRHLGFWLAAGRPVLVRLASVEPVLLPFVAGMVIAYFLNPIVDRLSAAGLPRMASTVLLLLLATAALVLAAVLLLPPAIAQGRELLVALPGEAERLKSLLETRRGAISGPLPGGSRSRVDRGISGFTDAIPGVAATIAQSSGAAAWPLSTCCRSCW